jgi:hypothetical protein
MYFISKEIFPRSEGLARMAYQFAEKYEKIGGRSERKRPKELYSASPDCFKPKKVTCIFVSTLTCLVIGDGSYFNIVWFTRVSYITRYSLP